LAQLLLQSHCWFLDHLELLLEHLDRFEHYRKFQRC
jgi:hypothetical protein